ncbi:MAG: efflux RND transporter permease subunit, partial [Planctomycetota bacterium]
DRQGEGQVAPRQLFRDQALAVVFSLLASLGVSLFLIPMLASRGSLAAASTGRPPAPGIMSRLLRPLDIACKWSARTAVVAAGLVRILVGWLLVPFVWLFGLCYRPIETAYPAALRLALHNRLAVLLLAAALAVFAGFRATRLGSEVLPEVHEGQFEALVFLARDVDVERTDQVTRPLERRIRQLPGVKSTFLTSGTARDELRSSEEGRHSARIHIVLEQGPGMQAREEDSRRRVREILDAEPAVQGHRFQTPTLFSVRTPISIEVLGHDLGDLMTASQLVAARLGQVPNLSDIRSTLNRGNTEVVVRFDRERLAEVGLEIGEATRRLAAMVQGEVPTRYGESERKVDMRVRLDPEQLSSVRALGLTDLAGGGRIPILLSSVAELKYVEGPSEIRRLDSRRGAEIQATLVGLDLGRVQSTIEDAMASLVLPDGVELRFGGQREEMERSRSSMIEAMLLAIFLVYVVMAAQFESLVQPFIIIFSVPLALIGVVLSLDLLEIPISVIVFIGAIMLAGIVVNNAIVLLDRINQERAGGKSLLDAVVDGAGVRFRPVLMTTLTTILGLLPLTGVLGSMPFFGTAGEGVELRAPMAITVITGLGFSTLLTLIVIPVTYAVVVRDRRPEPPVQEA